MTIVIYMPMFFSLGMHLRRRNLEWIGRNSPKTISLTGQHWFRFSF